MPGWIHPWALGDYITCCVACLSLMSACLCKHKQVLSSSVAACVYSECRVERVIRSKRAARFKNEVAHPWLQGGGGRVQLLTAHLLVRDDTSKGGRGGEMKEMQHLHVYQQVSEGRGYLFERWLPQLLVSKVSADLHLRDWRRQK